jgi:RNA polymerase sigma factor (sigma-70 family)
MPALSLDSSGDLGLASLSPDQRQALLMRFSEDRDFAEIAERLKTSESNARKLISRAVQKLKALAKSKEDQ